MKIRVLGALETVFLVGLAISFPFAGLLIGALGPKVCYAVAGAGTVAAAVLIVPLLRQHRASEAGRSDVEAASAP